METPLAITQPSVFVVAWRYAPLWLLAAALAFTAAFADNQVGWLSTLTHTKPVIPYATVTLVILALGCEFIDATIGMGYGTTLTPVLILLGYPVHMIIPATVLSQLGGNISAAFFHHQLGNVDFLRDHKARNSALIMGGLGLLVAMMTASLAIKIPGRMLQPIVASIVLAMGVFLLVARQIKPTFRWRNIAILSMLAAFNKSLTGGGYGPLVCGGQILAGINVRSAVATTAVAEAVVCVATVGTYWLSGVRMPLELLLPLMAGALLSTPLSALVLRKMSIELAKKLMGLAISVLGLLALLKVITAV